MKSTRLLWEADYGSLRSMIDCQDDVPRLSAAERESLEQLLAESRTTRDERALEEHVALQDAIRLVCPTDRADWYEFEIVPPRSADVDADRISVTHPMCLAVLGKAMGDQVSWDTTHGIREMTIERIHKAAAALA
jgi:transcription elongation GreA/GreB family factor